MKEYIKSLREKIGHDTIIQCAASIIVTDKEGRILLGRRCDNHLWGYAGGSVEIDEKVEDCALRELKGEFGLTADELEFFMINSGQETHYIYPNGDEVSNVEIVYLCHKYHGDIVLQADEMEEYAFFSPKEIDILMISDPIRSVIKEYLRRI